ncbi:MAG: tRNA pseudouridine(55) synthase, partial [Ignavibacteria bacterium]|nr:tRNA pseudouridine(55) synthase [Ignavibacteria bacterium]
GCDKEYEGVMILGEKTKSFDSETEVFEKNDISHLTPESISEAVKAFTGEIQQVPPMYSAVKHKGKPLYKMARKGEVLERAPKLVNVRVFETGELTGNKLTFRVLCSKGTYIRSLASDLGDKLGTGAYLKELRRTKIGEFDIKYALHAEDFINMNRSRE